MISNEQYVRHSLELNLFFLRIIKEHSIFAAASLPPKDAHISMQFIAMKESVEKLLSKTLSLAKGNITEEVMNSSELVTPFTLAAEKAVQFLTGIPINTTITVQELKLIQEHQYRLSEDLVRYVSLLNQQIIKHVNMAIAFQSNLLKQIKSCQAFSFLYPTNLDHVTREARVYVNILKKLENRDQTDMTVPEIIKQEIFWNDIMGEHAKFIRGYLDPYEKELFNTANEFAEKFEKLEEAAKALAHNPDNLDNVTKESYEWVKRLRDFKIQGTKGLLSCKIEAIMSPLLADHVTREANYYLRLLRTLQA